MELPTTYVYFNHINIKTLHFTIEAQPLKSIRLSNIYTELYIPLWCGKTTYVITPVKNGVLNRASATTQAIYHDCNIALHFVNTLVLAL